MERIADWALKMLKKLFGRDDDHRYPPPEIMAAAGGLMPQSGKMEMETYPDGSWRCLSCQTGGDDNAGFSHHLYRVHAWNQTLIRSCPAPTDKGA